MASDLQTLISGLADLQAKRLSLTSEDTAYANAQATTLTEFDYNAALAPTGSTWATDADVTVGAGSPDPEDTWGAAAISDVDGYTVAMAGGHGDSGRNAVMALDVQAAAANINGGGSGIVWARKLRGARFIAGALARPSSGTSPTGAQQIAADPAQGPAYWTMPSLDGVAMPCVVHPWHSFKFAPGTAKAFCSGGSGFADNQSSSNAGFYWDRSSNTMNGPFVAVGGAPSHCTVAFGYVGGTEGPSSLAISILTGRIYTINNIGNFAWKVTYWTNPDNSSITLNDTGVFDPSLAPFDNADAIIIPDPADATKEIYFQHGAPQGSGTDANFLAITDINGSPTFNWQSYSGSSPTTAGPVWNHYAWDSKRKIIWMIDGLNLYQITPSALGLTHWTISAALTLTGDTFTDPAGVGSVLPSIQYVAADDAIIVSTFANTLVVRPAGWAPPTPAAVWQNWGLGAWSTSSTVASGAGTAAGSATVSGVSAAIKKAAGTVAGVGTATGHTAAIKKSAGSSAGVGSATGHGAALAKSAGTSAGVATAAGVGKSLALSHGTAAGVATSSGVGKSLAASHGTAAGVATVSGHGASLAKSVGNAAGLATVAGVGTSIGGGSTGVAAGVATVSGHGASLFAAHGTAAGVATVLGRSASIFAARGTSAGLATVRGVSPSAAVAGIQSISRRGRKPNLPMGFE